MGPFRSAIDGADDHLKQFTHARGLTLKSIPKPDNLDSPIIEQEFHRLSVAYGLSHSRLDIGEITPPSKIPDAPGAIFQELGKTISKDQV